jgi:O-antigen/teichoic acid export membrane protein
MGFASDLSGNALLVAAGLVTAPIILRLTSVSLYGFWVTTLSILGYLALTDLGLGISLTRLVTALTEERDVQLLNRLVSTSFFTFCATGILFLGIGLSFSPLIPIWFKIPEIEAASVVPAYQVAVLAAAIALPLSVFGALVVGFQRMAIENTVRNLVSLFAVGVSLGLLLAGLGIMALALASLFTVLVSSSINYLYARRLFPSLNINIALVNRVDLKRLITFGGYFQLGRVATAVALSTDNIVIAAFRSPAMVTPYVFTSKLAMLFSLTIVTKMPIAIFPALSQMFARKENRQLQQAFFRLVHYSTRLAIVASAFVAVANYQFITLWVGVEYFGGPMLNLVFVYWILSTTVLYAITSIVYASGDMRNWVLVSMAEAAINLTASILLVKPFGLVGVALGTSVGKTLTTGWYTPYWICKKLKIPIGDFIWRGVLYTALRSSPGVVLTVWMAYVLPTIWGWGWIGLVGLTAALTNLIAFEGIELAKPSDLSLRKRARQLLTLDIGGQ